MAVKQWIGGAQAIKQISTYTIAGTWVAADTVTITCGGAVLTFTVSATDVTSIAAGLLALINANDAPSQFRDAVWTANAGVITGTGAVAGVPFVATASKSSTSGTHVAATPTAATGPNFFTNAANWSGGTVPVDGDVVVLAGAVPILYGLTNGLGGSEKFAEIQAPKGFTGMVGLPEINGRNYQEYRTRYLEWPTLKYTIGGGTGSGSQLLKFKASATGNDAVVYDTGSGASEAEPAVQLIGVLDAIAIEKGTVSIAGRALETATVVTLTIGASARVTIGQQVTLTDVVSAGTTTINSNCVTLSVNGNECTLIDSTATTSIDVSNGTLFYDSDDTIAEATVGPGSLDCSDLRDKTITDLTLRPGGRLLDPQGTVTITTLSKASNVGSLAAA